MNRCPKNVCTMTTTILYYIFGNLSIVQYTQNMCKKYSDILHIESKVYVDNS